MFWKSKTPEEKLKEEIANMYQSTVSLALKQSSEPFMQAMNVRMAIKTSEETAKSHISRLAAKYNLSELAVSRILLDCRDSAVEYFLK